METNCCARCGQLLTLVEDSWAEDKGTPLDGRKEYCPNCYLDLVEERLNHRF